MPKSDYERKLDELDQILNDPCVPLNAARVWALLSEIVRHGPDIGDGPTQAGLNGGGKLPTPPHQTRHAKIAGIPWGFHPLEK